MLQIKRFWDQFWFQPVSPTALGVVRFIVLTGGSLFFSWHISKHVPSFYQNWNPISYYQLLSGPLSETTLSILRWIWLIFTFIAGFGFFYRYTVIIGVIAGMVYLGHDYNFGVVYHSGQLYIMAAIILVFAKADRGFIFWRKTTDGPSTDFSWPLRWIQSYVVYVLFLNGLEKVYYGGFLNWAFSESFFLRLVTNPDQTLLSKWLQNQPLFYSQSLAAIAHVIQLGTPLALLGRKSGILFFCIWSMFHVMVMLSFGNHRMFYSQILAYSAFICWNSIAFLNSPVKIEPQVASLRKKRFISAAIILFYSFAIFQPLANNREDWPFSWFGMYSGVMNPRNVSRYDFDYINSAGEKNSLFDMGNGSRITWQLDEILRGLVMDFNNIEIVPAGDLNTGPIPISKTKALMISSARDILERKKIKPIDGKISLRFIQWKEFSYAKKDAPDLDVIILEFPVSELK